MSSDIWYDYVNQAWVINGAYVSCAHSNTCDCYGHLHQGEMADPKLREYYASPARLGSAHVADWPVWPQWA